VRQEAFCFLGALILEAPAVLSNQAFNWSDEDGISKKAKSFAVDEVSRQRAAESKDSASVRQEVSHVFGRTSV
jgi:hypothetical protein